MPAKPPPDARKARLAQALRANLARRKSQIRARKPGEAQAEVAGTNPPQTPPKNPGAR